MELSCDDEPPDCLTAFAPDWTHAYSSLWTNNNCEEDPSGNGYSGPDRWHEFHYVGGTEKTVRIEVSNSADGDDGPLGVFLLGKDGAWQFYQCGHYGEDGDPAYVEFAAEPSKEYRIVLEVSQDTESAQYLLRFSCP